MTDLMLLASETVSTGDAPAALFSVSSLLALLTLTALEIVLGIDNVVFIAILTGKLPEERRPAAMKIGLLLAMLMRIGLLFAIAWVMRLNDPLFELPFFTTDNAEGDSVPIALSVKDLVLLVGGAFLIAKATWELHHQVTGHSKMPSDGTKPKGTGASFAAVITQILLLDLVFSIDSVITAVGMADHIAIMVTAVVIAIGVMLIFAGPVSRFVEKHPTMKVLALSFLVLIGVLLVADGLHTHVSRGYVYFAMAFAFVVDLLQLRVGKKHAPNEPASDSH